VTNDTGASHLAAASETPSVVLFGPSRPEQWGPLDRELHDLIDAWALAIHHNTLTYRLQKIALLTGLDPRRFEEATQIYLALLLRSFSIRSC